MSRFFLFYLLAIEIGSCMLGRVNLCHWAGQHVLIKEQEVGILATLSEYSKAISNYYWSIQNYSNSIFTYILV